jgi:hypothetical protein
MPRSTAAPRRPNVFSQAQARPQKRPFTGPFSVELLNNVAAGPVYALGHYDAADFNLMDTLEGTGLSRSDIVKYCKETNLSGCDYNMSYVIQQIQSGNDLAVRWASFFFNMYLRSGVVVTQIPQADPAASNAMSRILHNVGTQDARSIVPSLNISLRELTPLVKGKTVVLFDYVHNAATMARMQRALRQAGASCVYPICLGISNDAASQEQDFSMFLHHAQTTLLHEIEECLDYCYNHARKARQEGYTPSFSNFLGFYPVTELEPLADLLGTTSARTRTPYADRCNAKTSRLQRRLLDVVDLSVTAIREGAAAFLKANQAYSTIMDVAREHQHLLLGENNFTFTDALVQKRMQFNPLFSKTLVATEYMSHSSIVNTMGPLFNQRLAKLSRLGVKIHFNTDARLLASYPLPRRIRVIHFNFPNDGKCYHSRSLPRMLQDFFRSAADFQQDGDEVRMALPEFSNDPSNRAYYQSYCYTIFEAAAQSGYVAHRKRSFGAARYPGYAHAMTTKVGGAAIAEDAREYIFRKTSMCYQSICQHPTYGPGPSYTAPWGKKYRHLRKARPTLRDMPTDGGSSATDTDWLPSSPH